MTINDIHSIIIETMYQQHVSYWKSRGKEIPPWNKLPEMVREEIEHHAKELTKALEPYLDVDEI
jgi:hypothetical protein